jgi:hypothetical protein
LKFQIQEYVCSNFVPTINEKYTLTVISKGNTYTASETLQPVANITKIVQNNQGGFTGTNKEIKTYYQDPAGVSNYYLYKYALFQSKKSDFTSMKSFNETNSVYHKMTS